MIEGDWGGGEGQRSWVIQNSAPRTAEALKKVKNPTISCLMANGKQI